MHFSTVITTALFGASTMAMPAFNKRAILCPGLESTPECCAVNALGVADLNCAPPPMLPANITAFTAICASIGQQAQCCTLPVLSKDKNWLVTRGPEETLEQTSRCVELRILVFRMNHSWISDSEWNFMGDTMVIIIGSDGSDLAAGTEMGHTYADVSKEYEECKKFLASDGFDCESSLCHTQKDTSNKIKKRWTGLIKTLHSRGMVNAPVALETYLKITNDLEATHCHPATEKPRLQLRLANHKLMEVCHYRNNHWNLS
ncbi:MAG: Fungal hydrophobin [Alectoria sarmentosa]|nr:MAG: Fungal hydrophobin [Alectoria sarmentosa]